MAVTSIWDVCELKMNIISCLREDKCDADLARCARVHRSWTEFALDALWFGYPGTTCEENRMRTTALPSLPPDRRQKYASRIGVLVFTAFDGPSVHAAFDKLAFPRLKEVVLHNIGIGFVKLLRYLQPTLESLRLTDNSENRRKWVLFLNKVAQQCPSLKKISIRARDVPVKSAYLARFFRSIRPRVVTLGCGQDQMLTCEVLSALSDNKCLRSLDLVGEMRDCEEIKLIQLQRFLSVTGKPFANLTRLNLFLEAKAIPLLAQCFPALTWLRLGLDANRGDELTLKPLGNMSQLRYLEIVGKGIKNEHKLPARAFVPLGSLEQLRSLNISTSFSPCCINQYDSVEPGSFNSEHKFTRADASAMFSRLTALEHLSIFVGGDEIGRLYGSLSKYCPSLSSIQLMGDFDPQHLIQANAPVLGNVRKLSIENIKPTMSSPLVARLIYDFAPKLEKLSFTGEYSELFETRQIYTAWEKYRSMQHLFKSGKSSRFEGLRNQ